jgi:multiple sugar transport system substrate-binding protein
MKKLLVCLLVAALVVCAAACGAAGSPAGQASSANTPAGEASKSETAATNGGESVELTFWAHQEAWNNSYQKIAEEFTQKNPDIKIKFEFFPYDEYQAKLQTSLIAKESGADIYELWGGWGIDFASTGALAEIPEAMAAGIRSDSYPSTIGSLEYNGKLYGMPMEFNIEFGGMFVNLNLLKKNGFSVPTTWDQLIDTAKKGTMKDGDQFKVKGFDFVNGDGITYLWTEMILSKGGRYLNQDGTLDFTSAEAKETFTALADLVTKDKVTDLVGLTGGGDLEGYQLLYSDKALFVPRGPWPIAEGLDTFGLTYDKEFTYAAMPWYGDKQAFAAETGWALAVNGSSKYKDAAFKFLNYFFSDEVLLQHNIYCSMIPPKKAVAHNPELLKKMPFAAPLINILDKAQYIGRFNTDVFKEAVNNAFVDYCSGKFASVDEALAKLQESLNSSLK